MRALGVWVTVAICASACANHNGGSAVEGAKQFTLRVTAGANGTVRGAGSDCRGACSAQYASGAQVHLTALPDSGASFSGWTGACTGTGTCDLTLDADRAVTATFTLGTPPPPPPPPPAGQRHLTVVVQGKGKVTSSPSGIDCDSTTCGADFTAGTAVALTAAPATGYDFTGWGTDCSGAGSCSVTLSKDATVYANFVAQAPPPPPPPPVQVHLTASTTGPGTVTGAGLNCGESTTTCDVTLASGSSVTLTAAPAGGARFQGWGGACSGTSGNCQLTVQGDTKVTATFASEVLALAPNDGTNGIVLALNSTHLFFPRWTANGSAIWSVPKNGGEVVKVVGATVNAMVADDSYLYWTDMYNLYSVPVGGGQVAQLASAFPIGKLALDEAGALYWVVQYTYNMTGSIHRMQGRADKVIASGVHPTGGIAVDSDFVWFTDYDGHGLVKRVPRNGGTVEDRVSCSENCTFMVVRVDSRTVYIRDQTGTVYAAGREKGMNILTGGNGSASYQYNPEIDVNASVAYWNWNGGGGPFGIYKANSDGSGFAAVDSSNDSAWYGLRVDDFAVYYNHGGAIIRRLK